MKLAQIQEQLQAYLLGDASNRDAIVPNLQDGHGISRERRLGIYRDAYRARLQEALGTVYERTWTYLGDKDFAAAAARYIESHPSSRPNLRDYGALFPTSLREGMPEDPEVAELAVMDWNLHVAFDAPDAPVLGHAGLAALCEADWAEAWFELHPSVSLAVFEWNVLEMWHALDHEGAPPAPRRLVQPTASVFWRSALASRFRSLGEAEYRALADLAAGVPFAAVCERVAPEQAGEWLRLWIADELLGRVHSGAHPPETGRTRR